MKETICTIPINDIFAEKTGCPFCTMYSLLENQYADFVTGSAMMDPETRVSTNSKGFCPRHLNKITAVGKRLPNALILQTHLRHIGDELLPKSGSRITEKELAELNKMLGSCYICDRIRNDTEHFLQTVFSQWCSDSSFREVYMSQKYICLHHFSEVTAYASQKMPRHSRADFNSATLALTNKYLEKLYGDTTHFCKMFDYNNKDADWGDSKDAIERSVLFLSGDTNNLKEEKQ